MELESELQISSPDAHMQDVELPTVESPKPVALVTGAGSTIGRAVVAELLRGGYLVAGIDAKQTVSLNDDHLVMVGDVSEESQSRLAVARTLDRFGRLDSAVLIADIGGWQPLSVMGTVADAEHLLARNLSSIALGIQSAVEGLSIDGQRSIVATASVAGLLADPGNWAYHASKIALIDLVRSSAVTYAARGIRVNNVASGVIRTDGDDDNGTDPSFSRDFSRRIPLCRLADAREIAAVIVFLLSPAASYVTGSALAVDGGLTASVRLTF